MAAFFASSSSQSLTATAPVTAAPFTVSFWFNLSAVDSAPWNLLDTATDTNGWSMFARADSLIDFGCYDAGAYGSCLTTGTYSLNAWHFLVYRAISTTSRRLAILYPNGTSEHVANTTTVTPSSVDAVSIGAAVWGAPSGVGSYMDGRMAEYALWNADVQGGGAQLQNSTLRALAFGGPFALPHMMDKLIEYRSFRSSLVSSNDKAGEIYVGGGKLRQVWTNNNGVTLGQHLSLGPRYVKQYQGSRLAAAL